MHEATTITGQAVAEATPPTIIADLSTRRSPDGTFHDVWLRIHSRGPTRVARAALYLVAAVLETWVATHHPDETWKVQVVPDGLTLRLHLGSEVDAAVVAIAKQGLEHAVDGCALVDRVEYATSWRT